MPHPINLRRIHCHITAQTSANADKGEDEDKDEDADEDADEDGIEQVQKGNSSKQVAKGNGRSKSRGRGNGRVQKVGGKGRGKSQGRGQKVGGKGGGRGISQAEEESKEPVPSAGAKKRWRKGLEVSEAVAVALAERAKKSRKQKV